MPTEYVDAGLSDPVNDHAHTLVEMAALIVVIGTVIEALPRAKRAKLRADIEQRLKRLESCIRPPDQQAGRANAALAKLAEFRVGIMCAMDTV